MITPVNVRYWKPFLLLYPAFPRSSTTTVPDLISLILRKNIGFIILRIRLPPSALLTFTGKSAKKKHCLTVLRWNYRLSKNSSAFYGLTITVEKSAFRFIRNLCSRKYSAVRRQRKKRKNFFSTMPMICVEHCLVPCCSIINFRCIFLTKFGMQIHSASHVRRRKVFRSPVDGKPKILFYLLKKKMLVSPFSVPRGVIVTFMKTTKTIFIFRKKIPPFIKVSESMWKKDFANRQKHPTAI